jgi:Uma2 family endonuclease
MTWEAFEQLPEGDGLHRELLEGDLQVLPPAKSKHSKIASNTYEVLLVLKQPGLGRVFLEAGYKLTENQPTWVQPDVSFLRIERVQATGDSQYFTGAPDIAVEVVSPSESANDLERKVRLLLASGSQMVLVIYPEPRTVHVHLPDGTSFTRGIHDMLSAPQFLPGWEFPIAKIFED